MFLKGLAFESRNRCFRPDNFVCIEFPKAWDLEIAYHIPKHVRNQEDSDEEDEEDEELDTADKPKLESKAYQEFLQFLQLGCSGSPLQGYPTVVVILSTISSNVSLSCFSFLLTVIYYLLGLTDTRFNRYSWIFPFDSFLHLILGCNRWKGAQFSQ